MTSGLKTVGLFAGIGGLETGLTASGHHVVGLSEVWAPALAVLQHRFEGTEHLGDVAQIEQLPAHDLIAAGFPCTDLSPAGRKAGIDGESSGLVRHVFRLAGEAKTPWLLLENVPNLLSLDGGRGMRTIVTALEALGYRWVYRLVDSRFTGVPQRRLRVVILAALDEDPAPLLLGEDVDPMPEEELTEDAWGFYWTEGRGGLGWARDAVPTLKGGSTIGIASSPAVWLPGEDGDRRLVVPSVADGERLQGFAGGWTDPALQAAERDHRWKLVGNAVTVSVATWVGARLSHGHATTPECKPISRPNGSWPAAAFGASGSTYEANVGAWPTREPYRHLRAFLSVEDAQPLSYRAALGFLRRLDESSLRPSAAFVRDVERHVRVMRPSLRARPHRSIESVNELSWASSDAVRRRMQNTRQRDTRPEVALRRALHRLGLRYRLQVRPHPEIKNRLDVVFRPAKVAVDVRGCFWHSCPDHGTSPKSNAERWASKLERNIERDGEVEAKLTSIGWRLEVVWEHDDPELAALRVADTVRSRRGSG